MADSENGMPLEQDNVSKSARKVLFSVNPANLPNPLTIARLLFRNPDMQNHPVRWHFETNDKSIFLIKTSNQFNPLTIARLLFRNLHMTNQSLAAYFQSAPVEMSDVFHLLA
jgi:hypothetical protein